MVSWTKLPQKSTAFRSVLFQWTERRFFQSAHSVGMNLVRNAAVSTSCTKGHPAQGQQQNDRSEHNKMRQSEMVAAFCSFLLSIRHIGGKIFVNSRRPDDRGLLCKAMIRLTPGGRSRGF